MIQDFISKFSDETIPDIHQVGHSYYQISPELKQLMDKSSKRINREPEHAGIFLGEVVRKRFQASLPLLELIGKISDKKAVIDDNAEWLFMCGRDIFGKSVIKSNVTSGLALITNRRDEVLGLGNVLNLTNKKAVAINNVLDMGDYLRREMTKKRRK